MAKKVKFPLDMGNEVYVRTLEELKENYNSEKVTEYFLDGRLLTWLNDRYYEEEAEQVRGLSEQSDSNPASKLDAIFGIETEEEVEALEIRREKLEKLRQITADDEILDNVDSAAFSQEELGDLLDEEKEVIYLCNSKFHVPLSVKSVKYIGVNNPTVTISGKGEIDLEASGIAFENCEFSDDTKARLKADETIVKNNSMRDFSTEEIDGALCLTSYNGTEKNVVIPNGIEIIGDHAFDECTAEVIIIPDGVKVIDDCAFSHCKKLKSIEIPDSVTKIGEYAFSSSGLKSIEIPNSVKTIGEGAFQECSNLTTVTLSQNLREISEYLFMDCGKLKSIEIPYGVKEIKEAAFCECASLEEVTLPESLKGISCEINLGAFSKCTSLKEIKLPKDLQIIGNYTFDKCENLRNINIPSKVTTIEDGTFNGCKNLESISLPPKIIKIGDWAFAGCERLTDINISNQLTEIGMGAFDNCVSLRHITLPKNITSCFASSTFENCKNLVIVYNGRSYKYDNFYDIDIEITNNNY